MNKFFFELLQVAIGNRQALTSRPTDEEWELLYSECEKHALLGIAFCGVERLPKEQFPPFDVAAEWVHDAQVAKENNIKLNELCRKVDEKFRSDGFECCILKGQSNLVNYPKEIREYRTAGDIDIWVRPAQDNMGQSEPVKSVIKYVRNLRKEHGFTDEEEIRYHHIDMNGVFSCEVEVHFRPQFLDAPYRNRRFQKWASQSFAPIVTENGIPVPSISFNAVYQLVHLQRHMMDEGIGLRQILDYYMVLRRLKEDSLEGSVESLEGRDRIMQTIGSFGMKKFASAIMYVLQKVFNMPDEYLICKPDEKVGAFVLSEILLGGNFGRADHRFAKADDGVLAHAFGKTLHNLMFLRYFPEEVLWEPVFRLYHWAWRKFEWWRV